MKNFKLIFFSLSFMVIILIANLSFAEELPIYKIIIVNHKFEPEEIKVKANQKFRLEVKNEDPSSEEFESSTLNIEKIMGPKKTLKLILGPLKKGTYTFMGEFHQSTAKGQIIAE